MLYKRLSTLYKENEVLAEEYPFDQYYPLLENFIAKEVSLGGEYLSPYRFALSYGKHPNESIRFFLGLTDSEDIIEQHYKYECDICNSINLIKNEESLINFKCRHCGFEDHLSSSDHLSEVKLIFNINKSLLKATKDNLKDNPLSSESQFNSVSIERGINQEVSLKSAEEVIYKEGKPIGKKPVERQKKYKDYIDLL